jgi:hypothetical protein
MLEAEDQIADTDEDTKKVLKEMWECFDVVFAVLF